MTGSGKLAASPQVDENQGRWCADREPGLSAVASETYFSDHTASPSAVLQ